jgi:hypothetical protein
MSTYLLFDTVGCLNNDWTVTMLHSTSYMTLCIHTMSYTIYSMWYRIRFHILRMYSSSCLKGCKSAWPCFWNIVLQCACVSTFLLIFSKLSTLTCAADCALKLRATHPPWPYPKRQCGSVQGHSCAQTTSVTPCQPIQAKNVSGEAHAGHNHPWFQGVCAAIARATPLLQPLG